MTLLYLKALHIIGVVVWFAGLFYLVRLFVYHAEALEKEEPAKSILAKQFEMMEWRLMYIITWPGMVLAVLFGTWMIVHTPVYLSFSWMHIKLTLVVVLIAYHFMCQRIINQLKAGTSKWTSGQLRLWNEVATLILVAVVFLVVLKQTLNMVYGVVGFFGFGFLLMMGIRLYKRIRKD